MKINYGEFSRRFSAVWPGEMGALLGGANLVVLQN